jgi:hypothetical protein
MPDPVTLWRATLALVALLNITGWCLIARALYRRRAAVPAEHWRACRLQLLLAAGYVVGCAYRSFFPVFDIPRLCLVDSPFSSIAVGRSVATVAELCFAAQWALLLRDTARAHRASFASGVALLIVPLIAGAEIFSWYSVLTVSNFGHVVEESIWGVVVLLMGASAAHLLIRSKPPMRHPLIVLAGVACAAYVAYMFLIDVPRYWERWYVEQASGHHPLTIAQGLADASHRRIVSTQWASWRGEATWMTLYFSVAVWLSLSLVNFPRLKGRSRP